MARFQVKNLTVDIVSSAAAEITPELCLFPTKRCPHFTLNCPLNTYIFCWRQITLECPFISDYCLLTRDGCGVNYSTCLDTRLFLIDVERLVINPDDVKVVQKQVGDLLKAVETRGPEVARAMAPQTAEQAQLLERSLTDALAEVRKLKKELG